jgi:hypothetical protein
MHHIDAEAGDSPFRKKNVDGHPSPTYVHGSQGLTSTVVVVHMIQSMIGNGGFKWLQRVMSCE